MGPPHHNLLTETPSFGTPRGGTLRGPGRMRLRRAAVAVKRALDVVGATVALILTFPVLAVAAFLVKLSGPGPVLFRQRRLGLKGRVFTIFKLRTMVNDAIRMGGGVRVTEGDARITAVGRILRATHIDELPQFLNVIRGDMSLIGPRPTLPFHYDYYAPWEMERLEMLPGITGWSQVNGGNRIDWDERIRLDVWYVQNWSLWLDLRILTLTLAHLVTRSLGLKRDAYSPTGFGWNRGLPEDLFSNSISRQSENQPSA